MTVSFLEIMYSKSSVSVFDTITNIYFKIILPLFFILFIGGSLFTDSISLQLLPAFMMGSVMVFALLIFGMIVNL